MALRPSTGGRPRASTIGGLMSLNRWLGSALVPLALVPAARAQRSAAELARLLDARGAHYAAIAKDIWHLAELGHQETESSALLQAELAGEGFAIERGVAGMPTAFIATWGRGEPVIAMLAEFDALPGLSQDTVPERRPLVANGAGHACGHHLFGTASTAAGIAVRNWLASQQRSGTIRVYGTPAEEGGGGKVYLLRAGLFDDVDVVLHWHPDDKNDASPETTLANKTGKFRFHGLSAHASSAPERGRSALDGVEAMNHMVNLLREHVPQETRIHYVITRGGSAPNVVPDFAEVYYYARHPSATRVQEIWTRIEDAARGAALGTGTRVEVEVVNGVHSVLPNVTLHRLLDEHLRQIGGFTYTEAQRSFAREIRATLGGATLPLESTSEVQPFREVQGVASTDVGDVSWNVPTAGIGTATWVPGTPAHSWQAVAAGGTSIGAKGMMLAAKTLAATAVELFERPGIIAEAKRELDERRGAGFVYRPLIGDRDPPLDYRR